MTGRAWPIDAVAGEPEYAARHGRQTSLAPLLSGATAARPLGAVSGVRPGTPSTTVEVSGSTWTVHPHAGILDVQVAAEAGPYGFAFDADETGSIDPPHATLTRWDGLYVVLDDPAEDESSVPECRIEYHAGTTTPALPTAPDRSLRIARLVVPQSGGGSASVVWDPPVAVAAGGIYPNPTAAQMTALDAVASASSPLWVDDAGVLKRSVGSSFQVVAPRRARAVMTGTVGAVANSTLGNVSWSATGQDVDPISMHSASGPSVVIPWAGLWRVTAAIGFATNATGMRVAAIRRNGTTVAEDTRVPPAAGPTQVTVTMPEMQLAAGDVITVAVWQNSGGPLNLDASEHALRLSVVTA